MAWAAVTFLSLSWLFAFGHYVSPQPGWQGALLGAAVVCAAIAWRGVAVPPGRGLWWGLALVLVVAQLLIALPPYRPGLWVLAVGLTLVLVARRWPSSPLLRPLTLGFLFVGATLLLQSATFWLATTWMAKNPELPLVGWGLYHVFSWLGADVSFSDGTLYYRTMRHVHAFPLLWEHIAFFGVCQLWIGGAVLLALDPTRRWWRALPRLTLILAAYAVARLGVMIAVFIQAMLFVPHESDAVHVEVFWLPTITAASFLPLIVVLARLLPSPRDLTAPEAVHVRRRRKPVVTATALGTIAVVLLTFSSAYWDSGQSKPGRVLIDEFHSEWERTDKVYDTDWYGHESGYNYYSIAQYLGNYFNLATNFDQPLMPERLADVDVLVLKTPTRAYSADERAAIVDFVHAGGGLLTMGEHTNVFGSSLFLNEVLREFGLAYRYDSVFDIERKWEQVYFPNGSEPVLGRRQPLGIHPSLLDVQFYRFAVSCSVATDSWQARPVVRGHGLWSLPIEYAAGNFYPHVADATAAPFGTFNQVLCTTAGAGRVYAFSDSTVYSNFLAFYPGKLELLVGAVDWLNRSNRFAWVNWVSWVAGGGLVLLAAGLLVAARPGVGHLVALSVMTSFAGWATLFICGQVTRAAYPSPMPHTDPPTIVFDLEHGARSLPVFGFTQDHANSYEVFYQWVLRPGFFPRVTFALEDACDRDAPIVIANPSKPFSTADVARVRAFCQRGGIVLLLDDAANSASTANSLLGPFGLSVAPTAETVAIAVAPGGRERLLTIPDPCHVSGGQALLGSAAGDTLLAWQSVGAGGLVVGGIGGRFTDVALGMSGRGIPDQTLRRVYELEFALLRGLIARDVPQALHTFHAALESAAQARRLPAASPRPN